MRQLVSIKPISMLIITLFAFSLATVTVSQAAGSANVVKGTIVSIDPDTGMLEVKNQEGKTVMLDAGRQIDDLKMLQKGDAVMIQYNQDKMVESIHKDG